MKRKALNLIALGWMLLLTCGCPSLWKYNYQEAYDEDEAFLSVPDPEEASADTTTETR
jgi:hypothetical protein